MATPRTSLRFRNAKRRGLTLLELIVAITILFAVLLPLSQVMSRSTLNMMGARQQLSAPTIANMILNQLVSDELPEFEDDYAILRGEGNVADFLSEYFPSLYSELSDRALENFNRWEYSWEKVLIVQNEDDRYEPYEDGSEPDFGLDDTNYDYDEDDPDYLDPEEQASKAAARFVRIRLELRIPGEDLHRRVESIDHDEQLSREAFRPDKHVYITFIDLDDFKEEVEDNAPTESETPNPDANGGENNGGNNNGGNNNGGNG